jgi:hypothetical protein
VAERKDSEAIRQKGWFDLPISDMIIAITTAWRLEFVDIPRDTRRQLFKKRADIWDAEKAISRGHECMKTSSSDIVRSMNISEINSAIKFLHNP